MLSYLLAIFNWLKTNAFNGFRGILEQLAKVRWFFVLLMGIAVSLFELSIGWFASAGAQFETASTSVAAMVGRFVDQANSSSGLLGPGMGLANCVAPVTEMFSVGVALLGLWALVATIRGLVFLYRLIPFKAS